MPKLGGDLRLACIYFGACKIGIINESLYHAQDLVYAISGVQVKQKGQKLNAAYQHQVCVDVVNIVGGDVHTVKENAEVSVVASKRLD